VNIYDAIQDLNTQDIHNTRNKVTIYEKSFVEFQGTLLQMVKVENKKYMIVTGTGNLYDEMQGEIKKGYKLCPLTHENRLVLNKYFEYTKPRAFGNTGATMGLGDRLGLASPGHIKAIGAKEIKPVLAQQSIRELDLTNRSYEDVLDAVSFAVFQEGYKGGYGADGDHLKLEEDIKMSLDLGFTMITLDCSDKIDNTIPGASEAYIESKYNALPEVERNYYENKYLNRTFHLKKSTFFYEPVKLMNNVLIYGEAIKFMKHVYEKYIKTAGRVIDFEISIDETMTPTAPESHYFIAKELYSNGVKVNSMAPRFIGEFQKAIDYIGDVNQFEEEFKVHVEIADAFGYKLSIHSGSDKFSVFPIINKYTKGRFHVKTAGTNWLEGVRVVAEINPTLYRRMHQFALEHFEEAKQYYHVTTDIKAIKDINLVFDDELVEYMNDNNARQLIHITYGILLQATDNNGEYLFKDEFYRTLSENEEKYEQGLISHIGKHIELLGIK
jgi:hypothetical protein